MLRKIHLYGTLAQKFVEELTLDVASVGEAVFALDANFSGFMQELKNNSFHVLKGVLSDDPQDLGKDNASLSLLFNDNEDFHFIPVVEGEGGQGLWTTIAGTVIVVAALAAGPLGTGMLAAASPWYTAGLAIGASLAFTGVSMMLSGNFSSDSDSSSKTVKERSSYVFSGPVNVTEQGGPVPLVYGEMIVGSIVAGGSIDIEDIPYG